MDDDLKQRVRDAVRIDEELDALERMRPSWSYEPSHPTPDNPYGGQLPFHRSTHAIRFLCPGNGWGKSAAMGQEANAWATHSNRWQQTPRTPVSMIWFGPGEDQWDKIRKELLEPSCFDRPYTYARGKHTYIWPDGSTLQFRSHAADWVVGQGINPDLILFDELFPMELWTEMLLRRRGKRATRFVVAATQTLGMSWQEAAIYRPWLEHHAASGLDEDQAMIAQSHPDIFCWSKGGIASNPGMTARDVAWYEDSVVYSSEEERRVRLEGGFGNWDGAAVFDFAGVRFLQEQAKAFRESKSYVSLDASIVVREAA